MSLLHVHRSTKPKENSTSSLFTEQRLFDRNIVHCLYNLLQRFRFHKTLTTEDVKQQLELVFDINVIYDQYEKLSESVLGQCVQQVHVEAEADTLNSVTCKYIYGSRVAANRVKPGTSVPTVGYYTLENRIKMHDMLLIQSKVRKKLIQSLSGINDELLKAGDISSVSNTNAAKQNMLANFYEHIDYQNELKSESMHVGLCFRLVEELWDRSPTVCALPPCFKDYSGQTPASLLSWLLGSTSKYTFALNKYRNTARETAILAEVANCWRINTDNSLSPRDCECNIDVQGENQPVSGVVIMTDNLKVKLRNHIFTRSTKLTNKIVVCDVNLEDFHPQKAFITDGKIKMESTNLFVKNEKPAEANSYTKKVEFLRMGSETFAIHVIDPAYYQGETTAKNRFKEMVTADFMMPLAVKFTGDAADDLFKREDTNPHVLPTRVFFKDAKGVTKSIGVECMIPYITGYLKDTIRFKECIIAAERRLSKLFKLSQITKGREADELAKQKYRAFQHMETTFPTHYHTPVLTQSVEVIPSNVDILLDDVYQKPLWIMTGGLTYESIVTNILALWKQNAYTTAIFDKNKLAKYSLSYALRTYRSDYVHKSAKVLILHAVEHVKKHNPNLYPWIANRGKQLKRLLVDKLHFPEKKIADYVDFVLYLVNSERLYKDLFSSGGFHLGLGFVLNRTETFDSESMLISRVQGYKLFYSQTKTDKKNDCHVSDYHLITSMQTGHMPSALGHPCIRYPHCILSEFGTMGSEIMSPDFFYDKKKPVPKYDEHVWIPIFCLCEVSEEMFQDSFNPFGRSNVPFDRESMDFLLPDTVMDPLSGISGYNPTCLGMINMNYVCQSRLLVSPSGFSLKRHVVPNCFANFWFNEFQKNATRNNNRILMKNLQENIVAPGEMTLHYDDLAQVIGGSNCKFCFSDPKLVKTVMSERDNRPLPGRNVYRMHNDYLLSGSKLMETLDRGVNANDRYLL